LKDVCLGGGGDEQAITKMGSALTLSQ
jgi:hypothetical protein